MAYNVIDLGLDAENTIDISYEKYWTPDLIEFFGEDEESLSFTIHLVNNSHRMAFCDAFLEQKKIKVSGSVGKNACFWFSVDDHTIIADVIPNELEIKDVLKTKDILFYFYDYSGEFVGVVKIKKRG